MIELNTLFPFFSLCSLSNRFEKLLADGSNANLIDHNQTTTVFVHGFVDSFQPEQNSKPFPCFIYNRFMTEMCFYILTFNTDWMNDLCRIESKNFNRNTIALNFGRISRCNYNSITDYFVPKIGHTIYEMLNDILKVNLGQVYCVGHSLGAHICGYAGLAAGGQFERCYGIWYTLTYSLLNNNFFFLVFFLES